MGKRKGLKYHENFTAKYGYPCVSMCNDNLRARRHDRTDKRTALLPQTCVYVLRAIDRSALSMYRAAPSRDLLLAQASIDGATTIDGLRCDG